MRVLVCGYGSIGRKHALNLREMGAEVRVLSGREQAEFAAAPSLADGLSWCDAAVIATATDSHMAPALAAARARRAFYLEKPVSHTMDGAAELCAAAEGLAAEVGCQLRFHPNMRVLKDRIAGGADGRVMAFAAWVGQRLDQWRPGTDYRACYSADSARGGGALFDLVHEIDLVHWLAGPVASVYADLRHNGDLEMKAEDLANLVLVTAGGAAGTVQLDMLSPAYRRGLQIVCGRAVYHWDMKEGILERDDGAGRLVVDRVAEGYAPARMIFDAMAHFLRRAGDPLLPASCTLAEGVHDLAILLAARRAHEAGARQGVGD